MDSNSDIIIEEKSTIRATPSTTTTETISTTEQQNKNEDIRTEEKDSGGSDIPTVKELLMYIRQQQLEQSEDRELIKQLLNEREIPKDDDIQAIPRKDRIQTSLRKVGNPRRSTLYIPETPQRVSGRTSMGGTANFHHQMVTHPDDDGNEDNDDHDDEGDSDDDDGKKKDHHNHNHRNKRSSYKKGSNMKVKEPPIFQGDSESDVTRWLELIEDFMSCFDEEEVIKVQKVMLYLGDGPRIFVKGAETEAIKEKRPFLWEDVKKTVLECFLPTIIEEIALMLLFSFKQTGSVC